MAAVMPRGLLAAVVYHDDDGGTGDHIDDNPSHDHDDPSDDHDERADNLDEFYRPGRLFGPPKHPRR
jgi:hypothetical protein